MTQPDRPPHYRWNFWMWVVETSTWMFAIACIDGTTVLPVLVQTLSGSPFLVGLLLSLRYAGQGWPQLITASLVSGRGRRKTFYLLAAAPGRLILLWPALALLAGVTGTPAVAAIIIADAVFWLSEGFSIVPWVDLLGTTIPAERRGRLFGIMHGVGGLLGIGAGFIVADVLRRKGLAFPMSYGVLFLLAWAALVVSLGAYAMLREPPTHPQEERYSTWALVKDIPNLLRGMPALRQLVLLQALFGFALLPAPFYILYVSGLLQRTAPGVPSEEALGVGAFLIVQTTGMVAGNVAWGFVAERWGARALLHALAICHAIVPLWALVAGAWAGYSTPTPWVVFALFVPPFFLFGGLLTGTWLAVTNYLLVIAPAHDRPAYIAVTNALNLTAVVLPMVGGLLQQAIGSLAVFAIAAIPLCYAVWVAYHMPDPSQVAEAG